ncbi:pyruvate dehydrogenase (acetyl-transferring), homodimeric type [Chromobacterium violaceum]|uniref:Pyruvate dehydrogenase E1 component n=1 Tax=Chromobacterium violaceum TaxID=536 RepID=A0A1R0MAH0_CHRVL|nr:pyruvate dehydrogenase (acetyl-transferring), homodimeric type [Chromobacterium violaceum]MBA8733883.1 pyruvate dehydrogenase (acetyl-transferring), homodimeric type [Chromobacterium violaceum]MBT2866666.1 pyruvate dehydrogenase (acetyl-transferring), homodimeric type [Chromobacterium violaceum]OLZ74961.1 pyruvate dehydrogenase (acetyl-transferring), homodimeric type [Chromobacterium violaceum]OQS44627.1 pyruvate dehydrogenase (acetyl-transferring), homodimeric type [Chromobacterium violaceu
MAATFPDDIDPLETQEWTEALESVLDNEGAERAHFLLEKMVERTRRRGAHLPFDATTAYQNTIPVGKEAKSPGNHEMEHRIRSINRWNAAAMVLRAGKKDLELGGHIASFQSSATLYDVGFNHFWRAQNENQDGDLIYFQGHIAPGVYARAFMEGRLTADQMDNFRQEVDGQGLSSYPHPWLMKDFWQFPTVSMGLGPLMAIYQARFLKYLESRGLAKTMGRKVWCFCGDGEMDEPESLGAIAMAAREGLDNLVFVINCNLQRLDGPVRGNGKIIQELEGDFRGSGWNVLKVIWGSRWDPLLAMDTKGLLKKRMDECVDGDYQTFKSKDGGYVREHFFGKYPELREMVANMSDEEIWNLNRGGHDPHKVYAAYHEATHNANGRPTVILAKTIKGYGMGASGEAKNIAHQAKKMDLDSLRNFRDRFGIPVSDEDLPNVPYYLPAEDSPEMKYMRERRAALGGYLPARKPVNHPLAVPELSAFDAQLQSSGDREFSTTMAFVRMLGTIMKDKNIGKRVVPIVPDESRTFGMEGMFRQYGIWSTQGQNYVPQDHDQLMFYKESKDGQILQEGINEPGAMADWIAAATSYANSSQPMIPFYIYYSMFGFQRIGDLAWAAGDMRARGFLLGGTAGRTTLNGEGLQHEDGHSHIQAGLIPNCISYDPTFAYELAVIVQDGMRRMYAEQEDVFYYLTLMNENYVHPAMPAGAEEGILKGMYLLQDGGDAKVKVQLMGSGTILREVMAAADLLKADFGIGADIWSVTSFNQLRRDGMEAERHNLLNPTAEARSSYVEQQLAGRNGPVIAATDYIRNYADQIRAYVPGRYVVLGTDGFGRSDSRANLRSFFEVDRYHVALAALSALARDGKIDGAKVAEAIAKYGIKTDKLPSWKV